VGFLYLYLNNNKMIDSDYQVILYKENFKEFLYPSHYSMVNVDIKNYTNYKSELTEICNLVKNQLPDWESAPSYHDLEKRYNSNSKSVVFYYNQNPIGWGWYNSDVRINWIDLDKKLEENWVYGGGLFVSKLIERPKDAGMINYNKWLSYCINELGYDVFCGYCHSWNIPAMNVHLGNGLIIENWYN